nr:uncharacterized protein LOC105481934 [Macaca nemestrina]
MTHSGSPFSSAAPPPALLDVSSSFFCTFSFSHSRQLLVCLPVSITEEKGIPQDPAGRAWEEEEETKVTSLLDLILTYQEELVVEAEVLESLEPVSTQFIHSFLKHVLSVWRCFMVLDSGHSQMNTSHKRSVGTGLRVELSPETPSFSTRHFPAPSHINSNDERLRQPSFQEHVTASMTGANGELSHCVVKATVSGKAALSWAGKLQGLGKPPQGEQEVVEPGLRPALTLQEHPRGTGLGTAEAYPLYIPAAWQFDVQTLQALSV